MNYLIGHLIGDYILQNDWMAQNKKKENLPCFVHCLLWTISVVVCTGWWIYPSVWFLVFASHWIFDRTQISMWYMKITKKSSQDNPFFPLVYVAVDNTCHLTLLWLLSKWINS